MEVKSGDAFTVIKVAAKQNKIRNQLLGRWHSDILSPDWTYERVVALPMVNFLPPLPGLCSHCRPFVLQGKSMMREVEGLLKRETAHHHVDHQYKNLLTREQFLTLIAPVCLEHIFIKIICNDGDSNR